LIEPEEIHVDDDLCPAWEQREGESGLWYDRMYRWYFPLGPSRRSINEAYRRFREQAQSGVDPGPPSRAPGSWRQAATIHEWAARARSWDAEQRRIEQEAHAEIVKKANERHLAIVRSRTNAWLKVISSPEREARWRTMSLAEERQWMVELIRQDRLLLSQPIAIEETRTPVADQGVGSPATLPDLEVNRFDPSPEMMAAVLRIYDAHVTEPPQDPEPQTDEPPPSSEVHDESASSGDDPPAGQVINESA
jgi:hypothetical protein